MNENILITNDDEDNRRVTVFVKNGVEISLGEFEAIEIIDCIDSQKSYNAEGWKFAFAQAKEQKPDRFAFIKSGTPLTLSVTESKLLKFFLESYIRNNMDRKSGIEVAGGLEATVEETEEEAMEKYPVSDKRNPLNLNYKKK